MRHSIIKLTKTFKTALKRWAAKDPFRESAVIAYYAIFAIPGLLVLIITITGYFFGQEAVNKNILDQFASTMGPETSAQISDILTKAFETKSTVFASILGIVILLLGATGVFVELQKTLNVIWKVQVEVKSGFFQILKARLFSFGLILAIAFLLLISLVISTALVAISDWIVIGSSEIVVVIFSILNFIFSLVVISVLFALMFKILPDAKIKWKHVWLGALVTGLLFTIGKTALAFYFGKAEPTSVYGAAGSTILILLWVSYSSMIMFFGAEFTAAYAEMDEGKITPTVIGKKSISKKH